MSDLRLTRRPFYFMRHGETDWNRLRVMQGHVDRPLTDVGLAQAAQVAPLVANEPIVTICYSPLSRAHRTAEILNEGLKRPLVPLENLKECAFGIYEGAPSRGDWRQPWLDGGVIEGGERYPDFLERALRGLNEALTHPGPVLVVAHGGIFWAIERYALKRPQSGVPNCTLFKLEPLEDESWALTELCAPDAITVYPKD
jgi:broad specificity phosphatase PhoE